ncbi:hypothetical protein SODG_004028 [Sodalis praecaptivus]
MATSAPCAANAAAVAAPNPREPPVIKATLPESVLFIIKPLSFTLPDRKEMECTTKPAATPYSDRFFEIKAIAFAECGLQ